MSKLKKTKSDLNKNAKTMLNELAESACDKRVLDKIQTLIKTGKDFDLYKINVFRIANQIGVDKTIVLQGFLYATRIGLFDLNWDIYCPSCRGLPEYYRHMMGLKSRGHCDICELDWELDFEKQVEVTFTINPAIRALDYKDFSERDFRGKMQFINETQVRDDREITVGECIFPDKTVDIEASLSPGKFLYWVTGRNLPPQKLEVKKAKSKIPQIVDVFVGKNGKIKPEKIAVDSGKVTFKVNSKFQTMNGFLVAPDRPVTNWVSAHFVSMQQEFKDLFDSEFLSPETAFAIQNVTLMFTDLKDSTQMYEEVGDSKAFSLVKKHFVVMTSSIKKFKGGIVKTIGDAVMAVFPSNSDALTAAMEIQKKFRAKAMKDEGLQVKIGIHRGPVIAVNSNNHLDYFGRTVNMAARVQGKSLAGEVLLSEEVFKEEDIKKLIQKKKWVTNKFSASLKGIEPDPTLYSISLD